MKFDIRVGLSSALLSCVLWLVGCDPDTDLDQYFRSQGLTRVKQLRDDFQPGGIVISVAGSEHMPYSDRNMFDFGRADSPSAGYAVHIVDGLQKYNAILPSAASARSMSAGVAAKFLAGYLPAEASSTLKLTGDMTVDLANVRVFRIDPATIEEFLSSRQSQAFSVYVRGKLAQPGTSAYVIYETYRSSQIRMSSDHGTGLSLEGGVKQVVRGTPGGQAKFEMATDAKDQLFVSGDRAYVFAIRTARLLPGAGQALILDASSTPIPGSLGADKFSAPINGDFQAVEFESSFPPIEDHTMRTCAITFGIFSIVALPLVRGQDPGAVNGSVNTRLLALETELASEHNLLEEQRAEIQLLKDTVASLRGEMASMQQPQPPSTGAFAAVPPPAKEAAQPREVPAPPQQVSSQSIESPLSFSIGGARFTPFGFVDLTLISRSTSVGSGSGTAFGAIPVKPYPLPASSETSTNAELDALGGLPETLVSAQNSRLGLRVDTRYKGWDVLGYLETDFIGASAFDAVTSQASNPLSVRLYFANLKKNRLEVLAGQAWSLLTPNRTGISPLSQDIFYTVNLDTNYNVGLTWSRSAQLRFTYHPTKSWTIASSIENPQQYIGHLVILPPTLSVYDCELNDSGLGEATASPSSSSVACNNQVPNLIPDIVAKTAWDGQITGHDYHAEIGALVRHFGVVNPVNGLKYGVVGGGISMNANFQVLQRLDFVVNTFASQGGGRFVSGIVPDVVARPDGSLSLVKTYSTLNGLEWGLGSNNLLYAYYGLVYGQKNVRALGTADYGFGVNDYYYENRIVSEPTLGFDHTFWRNPNYGQFQFNSQFSYVHRSAWDVTGAYTGVNPNVFRQAHEYMAFLNLRYLLP